MKGEVLVYIEGAEDSYKLYSKDKKAADSLYYDLEKCPICIDRPGGFVKVVVEELDVLIEAILYIHRFREKRLECFYKSRRVKEWWGATFRGVLLGALINRNYEGDKIASLIDWLESRGAISWNDRDTRAVPYKLNDNLILIFS